jgi:hypothetical protein
MEQRKRCEKGWGEQRKEWREEGQKERWGKHWGLVVEQCRLVSDKVEAHQQGRKRGKHQSQEE